MTKDEEIAELKQLLARVLAREQLLALAQQQKTLRDEFAMAAFSLVGTLENDPMSCMEDYADWVYQMADVMMEARNDR
jgi:hypothetical protein